MSNSANDANSWNVEKGFDLFDKFASIPARALGSGMSNGLKVNLKIHEEDIDHTCRGPIEGFKVLLHTPSDIPQSTAEYIRIPSSQEVIVIVTPNIITASKDLRKYSPTKYTSLKLLILINNNCYCIHLGASVTSNKNII